MHIRSQRRHQNHAHWVTHVSLVQTPLVNWLRDNRSLTQQIAKRGKFSLRVIQLGVRQPTLDETFALQIPANRPIQVRQVELSCNKQPVVVAETLIPLTPKGCVHRWVAQLGTRSLGALLFSHPSFVRGQLTFARLDSRHPLFSMAIDSLKHGSDQDRPPKYFWMRRSRFSFKKQRILVTEIFSDTLARTQKKATPRQGSRYIDN